MLKNQHRMRNNEDFQKVFENGKSVANRQFVIYLLPKEGQDQIRIGLSVSKKIGKAVIRNKVKRLIREVMREALPQITWIGDMIIIARSPVSDMEYQELKPSLLHCLRKAKLLT